MNTASKIFAYILFLTLFILLILEVGLRANGTYKTYTEKIGKGYHTYYGEVRQNWYWTNAPSASYTLDHGEFQYPYTTNSLGMREREVDWTDSNSIRLAVFGDSFTEGVGAPYDSTWPKEIERLLMQKHPDASVINAGMSGSDPFFCFKQLEDMVMPLKPTHVIFATNRTDLEDYFFRGGFERFQDDGTTKNRKAPSFHFLYKKSHLARMYYENVRGYDKTLMRRSELPAKKAEAAADIKNCMDSTMALCVANGVKFLTVVHITPGLLCYDRQPEGDARYFNEYQYDYPYVYLEDEFRTEIPKEDCHDYGWKTDGHFKGKGYAVFGKLLFQKIESDYPDFWDASM